MLRDTADALPSCPKCSSQRTERVPFLEGTGGVSKYQCAACRHAFLQPAIDPAGAGLSVVPLADVPESVRRLLSVFLNVPGTCLTVDDAAGAAELDTATCGQVLVTLTAAGFLTQGPDGRFTLNVLLDT